MTEDAKKKTTEHCSIGGIAVDFDRVMDVEFGYNLRDFELSGSGVFVPNQLCPKCLGQKVTTRMPGWPMGGDTASTGPYPCDICMDKNGVSQGIIPMARRNDE